MPVRLTRGADRKAAWSRTANPIAATRGQPSPVIRGRAVRSTTSSDGPVARRWFCSILGMLLYKKLQDNLSWVS